MFFRNSGKWHSATSTNSKICPYVFVPYTRLVHAESPWAYPRDPQSTVASYIFCIYTIFYVRRNWSIIKIHKIAFISGLGRVTKTIVMRCIYVYNNVQVPSIYTAGESAITAGCRRGLFVRWLSEGAKGGGEN